MDHLYYNVQVYNQETLDEDNDPEISFTESRNTSILKNAQDYEMSIIRFQINGCSNIPIFIPRVQLGQSNPNLTVYKFIVQFTYRKDGGVAKGPHDVIFNFTHKAERKTTPKASAPITGQDLSSDYYHYYTYSHLLRVLNKQFEELHSELLATIRKQENDPSIQDGWKSPLLTRDPGSGRFSLFLDKKLYGKKTWSGGDSGVEIRARLFFNSNMYGLFSNFHSRKVGNDVTNEIGVRGAAYEILPFDSRGLAGEDAQDRSGVEYFRMDQDFESTSTLWSPVDALVFTTSLIPVNPEIAGNPVVFSDGKLAPLQGSDNISELVITDLQSALSGADGYTSALLTYNPTAEYRMSNLSVQRNYDLREVSVKAHYRNRLNGRLYPLRLFNGGTASIKIMFRRKKIL